MLPDPVVINWYGNKNFIRQGTPNPENLGKFYNAESGLTLTFRQNSTAARFRREARMTLPKIVTDPITGVVKEVTASAMIILDEPRFGFTDTELKDLYLAVAAGVNENTYERLYKLLGGET
jgi:hypothetical protein